jgi:hypothetical protein
MGTAEALPEVKPPSAPPPATSAPGYGEGLRLPKIVSNSSNASGAAGRRGDDGYTPPEALRQLMESRKDAPLESVCRQLFPPDVAANYHAILRAEGFEQLFDVSFANMDLLQEVGLTSEDARSLLQAANPDSEVAEGRPSPEADGGLQHAAQHTVAAEPGARGAGGGAGGGAASSLGAAAGGQTDGASGWLATGPDAGTADAGTADAGSITGGRQQAGVASVGVPQLATKHTPRPPPFAPPRAGGPAERRPHGEDASATGVHLYTYLNIWLERICIDTLSGYVPNKCGVPGV